MVISPGLRALLDCIGQAEAGARGYNVMYLPAEKKLGQHVLTRMTIRDVQALQHRMVKVSASSAVGRYQFIRRTLAMLVIELGLSSSAKFTPALQDRLAVHLMEARGLSRFRADAISKEAFANSLAREWASLPVVTPINGKRVGMSYYDGDGLNHARVSPGTILLLLNGLAASPPDVEAMVSRVPDPALDMLPPPEPGDRNAVKSIGALVAATAAAGLAWVSENSLPIILGLAVGAVLIAIIIWRSRK